MKIKNTYSASLENLEKIFADAEKFCEEINADAKTTYALNLSLDEIFTNIVSYGYKGDSSKNVEIELEKSNDEIVATISDTAPRFNPLPTQTSMTEKLVGLEFSSSEKI